MGGKWLVIMVIVVGPLPYMAMKMAYKWGVILTTYKSWDDPASRVPGWKLVTIISKLVLFHLRCRT